jgi:NAD(P)H dehydrogenase (quinone)
MNLLLINGHPREKSLCTALAKAYENGARDNGHTTITLNLFDLSLEKYLRYGHENRYEPEGDVSRAQELISWSHHMTYVYPTWWAGPPALMRLFFEMVFSPGFAFRYHDRTGVVVSWDRLLSGKSARLISTMDAPPWYYKWVMGDPGGKIMKRGTLGFSGVDPIETTYFGSVKLSKEDERASWLKKAYDLGKHETHRADLLRR